VSAAEVLLLVLVILGPFILIAAVLIPITRRARLAREGLEEELGDTATRKANARGLGLESRGKGQMRGNGWLVLSPGELRFSQWVPRRETRIPLDAVTAVDTPRAWLGKTAGSKLVCVRWRTPEGGEDAMAWEVRDRDGWLAAITAGRDAG
jgi:hypothetical protein